LGPYKKFYDVTSQGNLFILNSVAHPTGLAYPRPSILSNIQSEFCIAGLWHVNSDMFTAELLSSYVMDNHKPAVWESGKGGRPSVLTPVLSSPRSLEEIGPFPKAVNNEQLKQGQSRVLTDTPEKNDVETLQSKNK
jgi:hypothetical protein